MSQNDKPPTSNRGVTNSHVSIKSFYTNVDWLTATTKVDEVGLEWLEAYHQHKRHTMPRGKRLRDEEKVLMGFQCIKFNDLTWGYNPKSKYFLVVASGLTAGNTWHTFLPKASNITRFDIAVTMLLQDTIEDLAQLYYQKLLPEHRSTREYTVIFNTGGGQTLYVGSRSSAQYGRVYDKGAQTGEFKPGNQWRYEVELKKPMSFPVAMAMYDKWKKHGSSVASSLVAYNHQWFHRRGIEPLFQPEETFQDIRLEASVSTVDKKLAWYRRSVRPSVQELLQAGYLHEVTDALGLDDYVQNRLINDLGDELTNGAI